MNVSLAIEEIKSTNVVVDYSNIGHISAITFKIELNLFFTTFKVFINSWLGGMQLVFPSNIHGIFELSNLNLVYFNNYVYCGATPTFIGPASVGYALHHYLTAPL